MQRTFFRTSKYLISGVIMVVAGCSGSSQGLPAPASGAARSAHYIDPSDIARSRSSLVELLKLEIAGKIPVPIARPVLIRMLAAELGERPRLRTRFKPGEKVGLWADTLGHISDENSKGKRTVAAIDAEGNGCNEPYSIKIDHAENLLGLVLQQRQRERGRPRILTGFQYAVGNVHRVDRLRQRLHL